MYVFMSETKKVGDKNFTGEAKTNAFKYNFENKAALYSNGILLSTDKTLLSQCRMPSCMFALNATQTQIIMPKEEDIRIDL